MVDLQGHRKKLIQILRYAHAGEVGAAYAYRGHWHAVTARDEVEGIRLIEAEEWVHRKIVRQMLADLGAKPFLPLEALLWTIGRTVADCPIFGQLFKKRKEN